MSDKNRSQPSLSLSLSLSQQAQNRKIHLQDINIRRSQPSQRILHRHFHRFRPNQNTWWQMLAWPSQAITKLRASIPKRRTKPIPKNARKVNSHRLKDARKIAQIMQRSPPATPTKMPNPSNVCGCAHLHETVTIIFLQTTFTSLHASFLSIFLRPFSLFSVSGRLAASCGYWTCLRDRSLHHTSGTAQTSPHRASPGSVVQTSADAWMSSGSHHSDKLWQLGCESPCGFCDSC